MGITELQSRYTRHPALEGLANTLKNNDIRTVFLEGTHASCASLFASCFIKSVPGVYLFVLNDQEEAGYFYHDMVQVNGDEQILFSLHLIAGLLNTVKKMQPMKYSVLKC